MKKKLLTALFFAMGLSALNAQTIENFESGFPSVSDMTFRNQNSTSFSILDCQISPLFGGPLSPGFTGYDLPNEKVSLTTLGNVDPILQSNGISQSVVAPGGSRRAIRLNDITTAAYDITSFEQPFTPTNPFVSFDYMLVLDSNHIDNVDIQPFFTVRVLDSNNQLIQSTQFCIVADPAEPLLLNQNNELFYTPGWYCGLIIIPEQFIGRKLKLQFITADCGAGGHTGVAYIDNIVNEKKCSRPQYGYVDLRSTELPCSPKNATICGTYSRPSSTNLTSVTLELIQNGVPVAINPAAITQTSLSGASFCFNVDFGATGIPLSGVYEFRVTATFTSTINGYVYTLVDESVNPGDDANFGGTPIDAYIDFVNQTISWPDTGGPYYLEYTGDTTCCPAPGPFQPADDGIIHSSTTNDTSVSFYDGIMLTQRKCLRFRVRSECGSWTEWCCITSYDENEGGYDITTPGESFDCVNEVNFGSPLPRPAQVYPNATTGKVTVLNSNSLNFELYDYNNALVLSKKISKVEEKVELDLSNLKQGIYILKIDKGHSIKIIKN